MLVGLVIVMEHFNTPAFVVLERFLEWMRRSFAISFLLTGLISVILEDAITGQFRLWIGRHYFFELTFPLSNFKSEAFCPLDVPAPPGLICFVDKANLPPFGFSFDTLVLIFITL